MDRIFLDANVLFSAAYVENSGLARLWQLKDVELLSSTYAVEEARRNLALDRAPAHARLEPLTVALMIINPRKTSSCRRTSGSTQRTNRSCWPRSTARRISC